MSDLKVYEVEINGRITTVQLSDADAKVRGLTRANLAKARPAPADKSANPRNKAAAAATTEDPVARLAAAEAKLTEQRAAAKPSASAITKAEAELVAAQAAVEAASGA